MRRETAYTYQAANWCESCARDIEVDIRKEHPERVPEDVMDLSSFDSGDYPKPYLVECSKSDYPEYCDGCNRFLHNPLTSDGYISLKALLDNHGATLTDGRRELADWYGFSYHDECAECGFEADECECEHAQVTREWRSYEMEVK